MNGVREILVRMRQSEMMDSQLLGVLYFEAGLYVINVGSRCQFGPNEHRRKKKRI